MTGDSGKRAPRTQGLAYMCRLLSSILLQKEPGRRAGRSRFESMLITFMLCSLGHVSPPLWASGSHLCIGTTMLSRSNTGT